MFIILIRGKEDKGAYSVTTEDDEQVLYLFEEEDDAIRYAMMLEEKGYPEMNVIEVENKMMLRTCDEYNYQYTIITKNDIVIPPNVDHDFI
jgi:hypothetical protein